MVTFCTQKIIPYTQILSVPLVWLKNWHSDSGEEDFLNKDDGQCKTDEKP